MMEINLKNYTFGEVLEYIDELEKYEIEHEYDSKTCTMKVMSE